MIKTSYTNHNVKSLTRLSLFTGTHAEFFRFLLDSKTVITDKLDAGYFTRCIINGSRNDKNATDTADLLILVGGELLLMVMVTAYKHVNKNA